MIKISFPIVADTSETHSYTLYIQVTQHSNSASMKSLYRQSSYESQFICQIVFAVNSGKCISGFTELHDFSGSSIGCFRLMQTSVIWSGAQQYCNALHPLSHLVVIKDARESSAIVSYLNDQQISPGLL